MNKRDKADLNAHFPFTFRAVDAPATYGKPTWHGQARLKNEDEWQTVTNAAGLPIAYASYDAAKAGALLLRDKLWVPNLAPEGA